jgi:hypothetical protein
LIERDVIVMEIVEPSNETIITAKWPMELFEFFYVFFLIEDVGITD